jgi:hypothetical protein
MVVRVARNAVLMRGCWGGRRRWHMGPGRMQQVRRGWWAVGRQRRG